MTNVNRVSRFVYLGFVVSLVIGSASPAMAECFSSICSGSTIGSGPYYTTLSNPGASETAYIAVQAKAEKDPDYMKFREVFSATNVVLQRYRVNCTNGIWLLSWEDLGTYKTADEATKELSRLVELENQPDKVVTFTRKGSKELIIH